MFNNNYYPYNNYSNRFNGFKKMNFSTILDSAQKTLSIINQAIPIIYQIKPLYNNAKVAFKVVNALKSDDSSNNIKSVNKNVNSNKKVELNNSPTFFI
ncbi:MAG: hypothetical protein IJ568_03340 [Bacilli bacterium]|nr:hypothetical protein [Bacilli bacterium]